MTKDLHPHWTSTDRKDAEASGSSSDGATLWQDADEGAREPQAKHTHVAIQSTWSASLSLVLALLCLISLSVLFFYGIGRIRGDLLSEMRMEVVLTISDTGITPAEVTVKAGEKLSIRNDSSAAHELQSDQRTAEGSPLLRTALIAAGERGEVTIPQEIAGTTLFLRSTILPTLAVSLSVTESEEELVPEQASLPAMETTPVPAQVGTPALDILVPELPPAPQVANPAPIAAPVPVSPASAVAPSTPVLTIGNFSPPSAAVAWPSILRVNRYTVSSPYVSPVQAVRRAEEAVRSAVHSAAPQQPATGPALWISVLLTLTIMPLVIRRKPRSGLGKAF